MPDELNDALANWDRHPDGDIILRPMGQFSVVRFAKAGIALRTAYWNTPGALATEAPQFVQLAMFPPQARQLGTALLRIADLIETEATSRARRRPKT
jgi:hypothetical protein